MEIEQVQKIICDIDGSILHFNFHLFLAFPIDEYRIVNDCGETIKDGFSCRASAEHYALDQGIQIDSMED